MKLRTILIYLCIFLALLAYVYFVEIRYKQKQEAKKKEAEKIVRVDKDKIIRLGLKSKDGKKIGLGKVGDKWVLDSPVKVKADERTVRGVLTSLSEAQFEKVLKEKDVKWSEYGLDKPDFTVTFSTRDDTSSLFFGASNPAKTSYYLRAKDSPKLLLVTDTLKNALNKTLFELRDKTVLAIAPVDVDRIVVTKDGKKTELKREGPEKWVMTEPEKIRVKAAEINRNLINLTNLQAKDIIDEPKTEGDPYGLNNPAQSIALEGKKRNQILLVGKAKDKKKNTPRSKSDIYARVKGQNMVYVIADREITAFTIDPKKLRDRYLMSFKPHEIQKVEVDLDGTKWLVVRSAGDKWSLEKPEKKENIETWPITGMLWDLKNLEWKDMSRPVPADLSTVNLDKPKLVVSVFKKGEITPIVLKAGWKDKPAAKDKGEEGKQSSSKESGLVETGSKVPAARKGKGALEDKDASRPQLPEVVNAIVQPHEEKGALFTVQSTFVDRLRTDLDRLKEKPPK